MVSAFPGLRKDTSDRHKITDTLHCSWGKAFWLAKQNCCSDTVFIGKLDVIGLKAILMMLKLDRRVRSLSLVTMANNAMEKTKHKNSLELPGTATHPRKVCLVVTPADGVRLDPGH